MNYITGIYALNLNCPSLGTPGDWHQSSLNWKKIHTQNTEDNIFGDFGITKPQPIPENYDNKLPIANHIRACLDLILESKFTYLQGMKDNYICNEKYNKIIFDKILLLKTSDNWEEINNFMIKEYKMQWLNYQKENN